MKNKFSFLLYLTAGVTGGLTLLFGLLSENALCLTLAITFGSTFYHFAMRLVVGGLGRFLPQGLDRAFWFREQPWEKELYRRLKVKGWKGKMPTYRPERFDLRLHTLAEMIHTTCVAEITHEIIIPLSFAPLLAIPKFGAAPVFVITSLLAALFDGIFVIMQRYNRPRLLRLSRKEASRL